MAEGLTAAGVGGTGSASGGQQVARNAAAMPRGELPFINREREIAALEGSLSRAVAGEGRLVLVDGEPGIGKTRLVGELVGLAGTPGRFAQMPGVVIGRCWEGGGAPSLWPWSTVLRELVAESDSDRLRAELGAGAPWIAALVPEVGSALPELDAAPPLDSDQSRFVLFDAITAFLRRRSELQPLLIVIDDIHAADQPSLLALLFLARQLASMRVLVVATHRQAEVRRNERLATVVSRLEREGLRLTLTGLARPELSRLIDHHRRGDSEPAVTAALHDATGGNPFFAEEALRLLDARGGLHGLGPHVLVPLSEGVQTIIAERLEALGSEAQRLLQMAAVIGSRFGATVLAHAADRDAGEVLSILDRAVSHELVRARANELNGYEFTHTLIRETAYTGLDRQSRRVFHGKVALALERRYAGSTGAHLEELAHHFLAALPLGDPTRALEYAERAADHAMSMFAHEPAARLYAAALTVIELIDDYAPAERAGHRARLLLGLGRARARVADPSGRAALQEAALAAREAGAAELLAAVALEFAGFSLSPGVVDAEVIGLLEEGLAAIAADDSPLRVQLLSTLARSLYWQPEDRSRRALVDEALAMARRLDDQEALAIALGNAIPALNAPGAGDQQLRWIDELLALPAPPGDLAILARSLEIDRLIERGALGAADLSIVSLRRQADQLRDLRAAPYVPLHQARRHAMRGEFDEAERLLVDAAERAENLQQSTLPLTITGAHVSLGLLRGQFELVQDRVAPLADLLPRMRVWRACLIAVHLGRGELERARRELDQVVSGGLAAIPWDLQWLVTVSFVAEGAVALEDRELAAELWTALEPFAGLNVTSPVAAYRGPVDGYLGLLAECLGELESAERHLRVAAESAERQAARPILARITLDLCRILLTRGDPAAGREARGLLSRVRALADELGLEHLQARAAELEAHPALEAPGSHRERTAVTRAGELEREGEIWTVRLDGHTVRLRDSKGVRQLATLLGQPGEDIHVLELVAADPGGREAPGAAAAIAAGTLSIADAGAGAGPALDDAAKAAYRRRIEDLREEIDESERWNDPERQAAAVEELGVLTEQLAAAVGIGGRDRPQAAAVERARVNVTRAIRTAIRRIAEADALLAAELEATVRTGVFCSYDPDFRSPVAWTVRGI